MRLVCAGVKPTCPGQAQSSCEGPELVGGCGGGGERKCRARAFPMCASGEGRRSQSGSCVCVRALQVCVRDGMQECACGEREKKG